MTRIFTSLSNGFQYFIRVYLLALTRPYSSLRVRLEDHQHKHFAFRKYIFAPPVIKADTKTIQFGSDNNSSGTWRNRKRTQPRQQGFRKDIA